MLLVGLCQPSELEGGSEELLFSGFLGKESVCPRVQQVGFEASLFVYRALQDGRAQVLVRGKDDEILVIGENLEQPPGADGDVVSSLLSREVMEHS